jgi:ElaB/YqjD/DUF883 family membrane-anchored ribosome-binding protein
MAEHPEVIRKQMEETRASLADKLEALENQVTEKVESTTEAVSGTVEAVKETVENVTETVQETVHTVAEAFNIKRHFERHPWLMFGGAVTVGCLAAYLLRGKSHANGQRSWEGEEEPQTSSQRASALAESATWQESERPAPQPQHRAEAYSRPQEEGKKSWFWEEVGHLKDLALGTLMGAIGDVAARSLPETLGKKVAQEVDHLASRLGAEPIHGALVSDQK